MNATAHESSQNETSPQRRGPYSALSDEVKILSDELLLLCLQEPDEGCFALTGVLRATSRVQGSALWDRR